MIEVKTAGVRFAAIHARVLEKVVVNEFAHQLSPPLVSLTCLLEILFSVGPVVGADGFAGTVSALPVPLPLAQTSEREVSQRLDPAALGTGFHFQLPVLSRIRRPVLDPVELRARLPDSSLLFVLLLGEPSPKSPGRRNGKPSTSATIHRQPRR
jgi:hypothetical protein